MNDFDLAAVFGVLADPARLRLLRFLLDDEHCVSQCAEHLELTQGRSPSTSRGWMQQGCSSAVGRGVGRTSAWLRPNT